MIGVETRENEEQDKFVFLVVRNRHEATAPVLLELRPSAALRPGAVAAPARTACFS